MKVFKILLEAGSIKYTGVAQAPNLILNYFQEYFNFDNIRFDVKDIEVDNTNLLESHNKIYEKVLREENLENAIFLGGDHSITLPIVRGLKEKNENLGLIVFDAHLDSVNQEESTHEDYLGKLIYDGVLSANQILVVGVRNLTNSEWKFLKEKKIKVIFPSQIIESSLEEIAEIITEFATRFERVHISIDLDVVEGSIVQNVSYNEPGGLLPRELLYFVKRLLYVKRKKSWDLVEVNASKEGSGHIIASRIMKMILDFENKKEIDF